MILVGTLNSGATAVLADLGSGIGDAIRIVLLADYAMESPPGYPVRPDFVGSCRPGNPAQPIKSGTSILVYAPEAMALIAASAAMVDHQIAARAPDGSRGSVRVSEVIAAAGDQICDDIEGGRAGALIAALTAHLRISGSLEGVQ